MIEIGRTLQETRRQQKLELCEVEKATRIRVRQLEALEHEEFDLLPPGPYRRSFLREYAEFLGLDGDHYADEFDRRFRWKESAVLASSSRRANTAGHSSTWPLIGLLAVALVILAAVAVWLLGRHIP